MIIRLYRAVAARLRNSVIALRMRLNPHLITCTYDQGKTIVLRDRRNLICLRDVIDNDNEHTTTVEYWDGTTLVHRSAHVRLKKMPTFANLEQGALQ